MHENLKKEIKEYLVNKYQPQAIILHGSRASDNYRPRSDWDLFVFVKEDGQNKKEAHEVYKEQALDVTLVSYPDISDAVLDKLVAVAHSIETLYEAEDSIGKKLVTEAEEKRSKGYTHSIEEKELMILDMYKDINNLTDLQENEGVFFFRLGRDFFRNALNGWFRVIRNEYSLPPYLSIPYIKKNDLEYYALLEVLWSDKSNKEKADSAKLIFKKIKESV